MTWGGGYCQRCQEAHLVPTSEKAKSEVVARMDVVRDALNTRLGRMVGVLIAHDDAGREVVLQAYSGTKCLPGLEIGWAGPTRRIEATQTEEDDTFDVLNALSQSIESLGWRDAVAGLKDAKRTFEEAQSALQGQRASARRERALLRQASPDDEALHAQLRQASWNESVTYRQTLKELRAPLDAATARHDSLLEELQALRRERRVLSNRLQSAFNDEHELTNFRGVKQSIEDAHLPGSILSPGAGECAAPKLLQDAVRRGLRPIAMAEAWVGPSLDEPMRVDGEFYGPCQERCLPILGHLLCGMERPARLSDALNLTVLSEGDDWLVVDKPGFVLATPGRGPEKIDSVLTRVRRHYGRGAAARAVHRLDHETSGAMVLALDGESQAKIQAQFVARTTHKRYLAWIDGVVEQATGEISLPLRSAGRFTREQEVHPDGKPALTEFRVLGRSENRTLVLFRPITGRSHQLRLHAAHRDGLGAPIRGDSLYGSEEEHLYLHAWTLAFDDPRSGQRTEVCCPLPAYWPETTYELLATV